MSVKEITVEYGYAKNLGNYESERVTVSATVTIDGNKNVENEMQNKFEQLKFFVHEKLGLIKEEKEESKYELNNQGVPRRRRI